MKVLPWDFQRGTDNFEHNERNNSSDQPKFLNNNLFHRLIMIVGKFQSDIIFSFLTIEKIPECG